MLAEKLLSSSGNAASAANYVEDVFSTYLYTGNGSSQTIINGIDLSTKGGMVWTKNRDSTYPHRVMDTVRGMNYQLDTAVADAQFSSYSYSANTNGYNIPSADAAYNRSGNTYVSWTFAKQPKFFDEVTWTGDGSGDRAIAHNLQSTPGCIMVKSLSASGDWYVYHRGLTATNPYIVLNSTAAQASAVSAPTPIFGDSSNIYVHEYNSTYWNLNASGVTYVAYIFAHNAGGFGLTGTDNVISCGSYTETSGTVTVNLGYEPQWLLVKPTSTTGNWYLVDNMRGFSQTADAVLFPNLSNAESAYTPYWKPTATGFTVDPLFGAGTSFIYIAIRRGPMKVPTDATKVFAPVTATVNSANFSEVSNFPVDLLISESRTGSISRNFNDRLRGGTATGMVYLQSTNTGAEGTVASHGYGFDYNTKVVDNFNYWNAGTDNFVYYNFQRAPNFFDEVCFTSANGTQPHNLGVAPELVIMKTRGAVDSWYVFAAQNGYGIMNNANAWGGTGNGSGLGSNLANVTSTTLSAFSAFEGVGVTCVAYLFASCPGVSKVGSYTGTGTLTTINCGFTGGSRLVLIKRTDSTGNWVLWDSARGMVAGTDPRLALNSTAAEVNANWVYTTSGGFQIVTSDPDVNASGGSYIFLSVA